MEDLCSISAHSLQQKDQIVHEDICGILCGCWVHQNTIKEEEDHMMLINVPVNLFTMSCDGDGICLCLLCIINACVWHVHNMYNMHGMVSIHTQRCQPLKHFVHSNS